MSSIPAHSEPDDLAPELRSILEQEYPRFSAAEMSRRRTLMEAAMAKANVDHLVAYGANRVSGAVQWLTGWPVTTEATAVVTPGHQDALFIQFYNHVPLARRIAIDANVAWGGEKMGVGAAVAELTRRGARRDRVGVIGPMGPGAFRALTASFGNVVDLNPAYISMRVIKSSEELNWMRIGAYLSDRAIRALQSQVKPGIMERDLAAIVEDAYLGLGGTNHIHFFGTTSMADPNCCVPAQYPSTRKLGRGDVLFTEISASFWDYPAQILRTFTIDAEPTLLYRQLHDVAEAAYTAISKILRAGVHPREVVEASSMIEEAGFSTYDDLLHGFGGGYLQPIVGSQSRPAGPIPDVPFKAGMTVVIQPNVITKDERAGVQLGDLVVVTETGIEPLHRIPRQLFRI